MCESTTRNAGNRGAGSLNYAAVYRPVRAHLSRRYGNVGKLNELLRSFHHARGAGVTPERQQHLEDIRDFIKGSRTQGMERQSEREGKEGWRFLSDNVFAEVLELVLSLDRDQVSLPWTHCKAPTFLQNVGLHVPASLVSLFYLRVGNVLNKKEKKTRRSVRLSVLMQTFYRPRVPQTGLQTMPLSKHAVI